MASNTPTIRLRATYQEKAQEAHAAEVLAEIKAWRTRKSRQAHSTLVSSSSGTAADSAVNPQDVEMDPPEQPQEEISHHSDSAAGEVSEEDPGQGWLGLDDEI